VRTSAVDVAGGAERCSEEQARAAARIPVAMQTRFDGIVPSKECQASSAADAAPRCSRGKVALRCGIEVALPALTPELHRNLLDHFHYRSDRARE